MVHNLRSCRELLARIYDELPIERGPWEGSFPVWVGNALRDIGTMAAEELLTDYAEISSYRVALPANLRTIEEVAFSSSTYTEGEEDDDDFVRLPRVGEHIEATGGYFVEQGYVKVGEESGTVRVLYRALRTDDGGWPMIPDEHAFEEAVWWYALCRLMLKGFRHPLPEVSYGHAREQYAFWKRRARSIAQLPDHDEMRDRISGTALKPASGWESTNPGRLTYGIPSEY